MNAHPPAADADAPPGKSKMKLVVMAVIVLLLAAGAGLWFSGILPGLVGLKHNTEAAKSGAALPVVKAGPPSFMDVPEIVTNLNVPGKRQTYVKLKAKLELGSKEDEAPVTAAMPRLQDLFQTYLREMRPEDLRGAEGSYRLREELIARAAIAVAPAHVSDVLFIELVIE